MRYTNRADLLIAAGESIKMQEKAGIDPVFKFEGDECAISDFRPIYDSAPLDYEFPLAVVESKPVWCDSILYSQTGTAYDMRKLYVSQEVFTKLSWTPPKPKTVMVELLREDAEAFVNTLTHGRISDAIRKALEN